MNFPACLTSPVAENTFAGSPISQAWNDLALWETVLSSYPPRSVVELGTWGGGMAIFLAAQGLARGFEVVTIDRDLGQLQRPDVLERLGARAVGLDVFSDEGREAVLEMIRSLPKPLLLFCDNGNKPAEFRSFVPHLSKGDLVAVHDWVTEFHESDLAPPLPFLMRDQCEASASMTRFFRVLSSEE